MPWTLLRRAALRHLLRYERHETSHRPTQKGEPVYPGLAGQRFAPPHQGLEDARAEWRRQEKREETMEAFKGISGLLAAIWLCAATPWPAHALDKVIIANVDALSGPISALGADVRRGLHLAVDQINAAGGIKALGGAKIDLVDYDNQSKVELAQSMTERAIADGAIAIIGNSSSAAALAATTVAERAGVPIVVSGASANQLVARGYKFTFKINPNSDVIEDDKGALTAFFSDAGIHLKRIVHVYEDGAFGQTNQSIYERLAPELGVGLEPITFKVGTGDMSGLISRLRRTDAEAVVFSGYLPDAITFTNSAYQARIVRPYMHVGISLADENFRKAVPPEARNNLFGYQYFNPDVKIEGNENGPRNFFDAYVKAYGMPPGFIGANAWTSMMVLKKALETAGTTDPKALRDALSGTTFGPSDGHIMPYAEVKFNDAGLNVNANLLTIQDQNGTIVVVWPQKYATGKPRLNAAN